MAKQILIKPVITEKSTKLADKRNTYVFVVNKDCNKIEVKNEVERRFSVVVSNVNTATMPGKLKSRPSKGTIVKGVRSAYKKAFVTLNPGEKIDIFASNEDSAE